MFWLIQSQNPLDALQAVRDVAELLEREIHQLVRIAVAARQGVAEQVGREFVDRDRQVGPIVRLPYWWHRDQGVLPNRQPAGGNLEAADMIVMLIPEMLDLDPWREGELLALRVLPFFQPRLDEQYHWGRVGGVVREFEPAADRQVIHGI